MQPDLTNRPGNKLAARIGDQLEFAKSLVANPKTIGAIAPTSARMANRMASQVRPERGLPVLELGPGTGVITKAILDTGIAPSNLYSIEFSAEFIPELEKRYPGVNFIHGDAFKLGEIAKDIGINRFDSVISGLPLLNFPVAQRVKLVNSALNMLDAERPFVQFSYGPLSPVPERPKSYQINHLGIILRNIPPARIWTYRREKCAKTDR